MKDPIEQNDPQADVAGFRRCLGEFATGVTAITTEQDGARTGITVNSFASLSLDPPLVLWSIAKTSSRANIFRNAAHFAVNVLSMGQLDVAQLFVASKTWPLYGVTHTSGLGGVPRLAGAVAVFECATEAIHDGGDHLIVVGRVLHFSRFDETALVFVKGRYSVTGGYPGGMASVGPDTSATASGPTPLSTLIYRAHHEAAAELNDAIRSEGMDGAQNRVMLALFRAPAQDLYSLARRAYLGEQATRDAVAGLQNGGFVRDEGGRLTLSPKGIAKREAMQARIAEIDAARLAGLSKADLESARRVLDTFVGSPGHALRSERSEAP